MNPSATRATISITCLCSLLISLYSILQPHVDHSRAWSDLCKSVLPVIGVLLAGAVVLVLMARVTMVTWVTVLVLLAFAGKRRRVLAQRGRKISTDVAICLAEVVLREGRLVAVACATVVSLVAIVAHWRDSAQL